MLKYIPNSARVILEVGCNDGSFLASLRRNDRETWGVETNREAAQCASTRCTFMKVGDFDEVFDDLPRNHFDCVVFNDVLEHMLSPWEAVGKTKMLLAPEGVVVSSIPNFRYLTNLFKEIIYDGEFRYKPEGGILDETHFRFFTSKSIRRMFREQGFEVLVHEGIIPADTWRSRLFLVLLFGFLKDIRFLKFATVARPLAD